MLMKTAIEIDVDDIYFWLQSPTCQAFKLSEVQYTAVFGIEGLTVDFDQFNPLDLSIPYFIHYTLVCPLDCVTTYNFLQWSSY